MTHWELSQVFQPVLADTNVWKGRGLWHWFPSRIFSVIWTQNHSAPSYWPNYLTQSDHHRSMLLFIMPVCDIDTPALLINTSGVPGRRSKSCWTEVSSMASAEMGRMMQLGVSAWMIVLVSSRAVMLRPVMMIVLAPARANCMVIA